MYPYFSYSYLVAHKAVLSCSLSVRVFPQQVCSPSKWSFLSPVLGTSAISPRGYCGWVRFIGMRRRRQRRMRPQQEQRQRKEQQVPPQANFVVEDAALLSGFPTSRFREAKQAFDAATERMDKLDPRRKCSVELSKAAERKSNYHQSQEVRGHGRSTHRRTRLHTKLIGCPTTLPFDHESFESIVRFMFSAWLATRRLFFPFGCYPPGSFKKGSGKLQYIYLPEV